MARFKETNKKQGQFIPVIFEEQILPGTIEHAICDIIDHHVDLSVFNASYRNDVTGAPAIAPSILLKIILACYSKGILSSRAMEHAVATNVQLMAIAEGLSPDHATFAAFVSSHETHIKELFAQVLIRCAQLDLIGGEIFALDGCKISSNASKEYSGTFAELEKKRDKLKKMLEHLITQQIGLDASPRDLESRKKKYEDKIAKIDVFLSSHEPKQGARGRELKSNVTDNNSAKMKSSHGVIQGYNGMAVVDAKTQVVVGAQAIGQCAEGALLPQMVEQAEENLAAAGKDGIKGHALVADANYYSEDNCQYCAEKEIDAYIPDQYFRNRDPRFPKGYPRRENSRKTLFSHNDFPFDLTNNCCVCPAGKKLRYVKIFKNHGYSGRLFKAEAADCSACVMRTQCIRRKAERRNLYVVDVPKPKTFSEKMIEKIDTPAGRAMYSRRMGIVEPVFANITFHKRLNRFMVRGKEKVNAQWLLFCMVHNIGKIAGAVLFFLNVFRRIASHHNFEGKMKHCALCCT